MELKIPSFQIADDKWIMLMMAVISQYHLMWYQVFKMLLCILENHHIEITATDVTTRRLSLILKVELLKWLCLPALQVLIGSILGNECCKHIVDKVIRLSYCYPTQRQGEHWVTDCLGHHQGRQIYQVTQQIHSRVPNRDMKTLLHKDSHTRVRDNTSRDCQKVGTAQKSFNTWTR